MVVACACVYLLCFKQALVLCSCTLVSGGGDVKTFAWVETTHVWIHSAYLGGWQSSESQGYCQLQRSQENGLPLEFRICKVNIDVLPESSFGIACVFGFGGIYRIPTLIVLFYLMLLGTAMFFGLLTHIIMIKISHTQMPVFCYRCVLTYAYTVVETAQQ